MSRVVERCPNCGVEHEASHVGPCEVCGTELRYWCTRHGRDIGWLDGPACPACAREAAAPRPAPPPPAPARVRTERRPTAPAGPPPRSARRVPERPDPREILPHVAAGAGVALRVVRAVLVVVRTVVLWALLGAIAGAAYASMIGGDLLWLAFFGLSNGAIVGLLIGCVVAIRVLVARRPPR